MTDYKSDFNNGVAITKIINEIITSNVVKYDSENVSNIEYIYLRIYIILIYHINLSY